MEELEKYSTEELKAELARRHDIEMEKRVGRPRWRYFEGVIVKVYGDSERMSFGKMRKVPIPLDRWRFGILPDKPVDSEGYELRGYNGVKLQAGFTKKNVPEVGDRVRMKCWNYVKEDDNLYAYNNHWVITEILEKHGTEDKVQGESADI